MSRPRSGCEASAPPPARRDPPARPPGVFVQAPKSDIYVAMLGVALGRHARRRRSSSS